MMNNLLFFIVKAASMGLFLSCASFALTGRKQGMLPNLCASNSSNININPTPLEAEKNNNVVMRSTKPLYWDRKMLDSCTEQEMKDVIMNMPYYVNITKRDVAGLMCKLIRCGYTSLVKLLLEVKDDIDLRAPSSVQTCHGPMYICGVAIDNGNLEILKLLVNKDPNLLSSTATGYLNIEGGEGCSAIQRIILNERDKMLRWILSEEKLRNSIPYAHLEIGLKRCLSALQGVFKLKIVKILVEEGEMPLPGDVLEMVKGYVTKSMFFYLGSLILANRRQCDEIKPLLDQIVNTDITSLIINYLLFPNVKIPKKICSFLEGDMRPFFEVKESTPEEYVEEEYVGYEDLQAALDKHEESIAHRTQ